jgi:hypothetical protein
VWVKWMGKSEQGAPKRDGQDGRNLTSRVCVHMCVQVFRVIYPYYPGCAGCALLSAHRVADINRRLLPGLAASFCCLQTKCLFASGAMRKRCQHLLAG